MSKSPRARLMQFETLESRLVLSGTWTALTNAAPANLGTMLLLTDGSIMVQGDGVSKQWFKLTPSSTGSYVDGSWSTLASMHTQRLYFASNILNDGRVLVLGGEYSGRSGAQNLTNTGEIYDPLANTWTTIPNFPQSKFGDDPTELLPDGRVLAGYVLGTQTYIYDPVANTWSTGPTKLVNDRSDEETWIKLPDDSILSYDVFDSQHAQRFIPSLNQWVDAGTVPEQLQTSGGLELGPGLRLPDGRVLQIGGTNHNALYTPPTTPTGTGSWAAAPDTPGNIGANDAPAAMEPNGLVLYAAGDTSTSFNPPTTLFEYDPASNTITPAPTADGPDLSSVSPFTTRMLVLPSGQILFNPTGNELYVYTPDGAANPAWAPAITNITNNGDNTFTLTGLQINGISEGASYGDDAEMASNYPIVRLTNASGTVSFARTSDYSSVGVATGSTPETTPFTLPTGINPNAFLVNVIANGIASPTFLDVQLGAATTSNVSVRTDPNDSTKLQILAGNNVLTEYPYSAFSGVIITGDGAADTITVNGNFSSIPLIIDGNAGDDVINVNSFGSTTLINGDDGNDAITLNLTSGSAVGPITIAGNSGSNSLKIIGGSSNDSAAINAGQITFNNTPIAYSGIQAVEFDTSAGSDTLSINGPLPFNPIFNGGSGNDTLNVNAGTFVLNSDAQITTANLAINIAPGASALFNATQHLAALNITGGSATLASNHSFVLVTKSFSISNSGTLDLTNNSMILDYSGPSPLSAIQTDLASGFDGGLWKGSGIVSSTAAADPNSTTALGYAEASALGLSTFAGQSIDSSSILIKYTYYGDNNLDGKVDLNDFSIFIDGFNGLGNGWLYGDYNYDGSINQSDFSLLVKGLNLHGPQL